MSVEFDLRQLDAVRKRRIEAAALTSEERGRLLGQIGEKIAQQTEDRFFSKIGPDGNRWADIAEATEEYYRRARSRPGFRGVPRPPLLVSGDLKDSIVSEVRGGNWSVIVGAVKEYADVHQYGHKPKNIPARPFVGVSPGDAKEIDAIVARFLKRAFS